MTWAAFRTPNRMAGLREELDAREVRPDLAGVEAERVYGCVRRGVASLSPSSRPSAQLRTRPGRHRNWGREFAPSPRPERGLAEQRLLGRGLRAPILRRRFDLAAEFGCGVPGPARVVEQAAGERDHVGLAGCDDLFGLLRLCDQADGDGGQTRLALDGLCKLHLIAGAECDLLQRRDAAGGGIDPVDAARLQ